MTKATKDSFVVAVNDPFVTKAWGEQLLESVAGQQQDFSLIPLVLLQRSSTCCLMPESIW